MSTKLDWVYQDRTGEYRADYKGLVIRAVHDDSPENPFEAWDGHFPMLVYHDRTIDEYDKMGGVALDCVIERFTSEQLVFDQKALAEILDLDMVQEYADRVSGGDTDDVPKWITLDDAHVIRDVCEDAIHDTSGTDRLDKLAELHKLLGHAVLRTTSRGYSQGDWAELLIVATPEAIAEFGCDPAPDNLARQLEAQAKLYGAWAWGDVWGYVVEKPALDEDGDEIEGEAEELDSCWGYYGSDFAESGLEEAALASAECHLTKEKTDA